MKKYVLLLAIAAFFINTTSHAQNSSGVITYENKINLHRRLTGEQEAMKAMIPEFKTINHQLIFDGTRSLYMLLIDEEEDLSTGGVRIRQAYSENYSDASSRNRVRLQEFMGKTYIIDDTLTIQPWKMGDQVKEIGAYTCKMAYYTDTTTNTEITAWFTTDLPPFIGPDNFNTLPGTVLAVDFNNGERMILAKEIALRELKKNELKQPEKGTPVTPGEYQKLVDEQRARMQQNGRIMIRN